MQHANLPWEALKPGGLLRCPGEDESFLGHSSGVVGHVKLFIQDFDLQSELYSLLVKLMETGDLPSQPPVVKVFNFVLQVDEVAARPE